MNFLSLFQGDLVRLAAPLPEDNAIMAHWSQNDEFLRLMDTAPARPLSPSDAADTISRQNSSTVFSFHIRTLADDRLIGTTELELNWANQAAWLAIGIGDSAYWGKSYGRDALHLIIRYAFDELGVYRINLNVISYNTRAIRLYEKTGFVYEGRQRQAVYRQGQRYDLVFYGLLRDEYTRPTAP